MLVAPSSTMRREALSHANRSSGSDEDLANSALQEVMAQLQEQGGTGFVWIDEWPQKYQKALGMLREFCERYPEQFRIVPGRGRRYTVSLISTANASQTPKHLGKDSGKVSTNNATQTSKGKGKDDGKMNGGGGDQENLSRSLKACNTQITELVKQRKWKQAFKIFESIKEQGVVPNVITFTTLISACGKGRQPKQAQEIFKAMMQQGVVPKCIHLHCLNQCLRDSKAGKPSPLAL